MGTVLVTGFAPFGHEEINPSFEAVKQLQDEIAGFKVVKHELPVVFHKSIAVLYELMAKIKPDIVLCVGQAGGRFGITPEKVAINLDDAAMGDNEGNTPTDLAIFPEGPDAYFAKLPVKAMVKAMRENAIPASVSYSAGTYVCNHIMYGLLHHICQYSEFSHLKGGFIHVPFCTEQVVDKRNMLSLTIGQIALGLEICVRTAITEEQDILVPGGITH